MKHCFRCFTGTVILAMLLMFTGCGQKTSEENLLFSYKIFPEDYVYTGSPREFTLAYGHWNVEKAEITFDVQAEPAEPKYTMGYAKGDNLKLGLGYPSEWIDEESFASVYPCTYSYDEETNVTSFVFLHNTVGQMYVAKLDEKTREVTWKHFTYPSGYCINSVFAPNTVLVGQWIYGTSGDNGPIRLNIEDGSYELLEEVSALKKNMGQEGSYDPDGPLDILPCGSWNGKVIWNIPFCTNVSVTDWYCVYGEAFEGAIYFDDDLNWHVYDKNWEEKNYYEVEIGRGDFGL